MVDHSAVPALRILVEPGTTRYEVSLEGPAVADWSEEDRLLGSLPTNWAALSQQTQGTLQSFLAKTQKALSLDWSAAGAAIDLLLSDGELVWRSIIGRLMVSRLDRLQQSLAPFLSPSDPLDALASAREAPLIEVKCPRDAILPMEILPLGLKGSPAVSRDESGVLADARLLSSFSCVVRYLLYDMKDESSAEVVPVLTGGLLPQGRARGDFSVTYLRSTAAPLWQDMQEFFQSPENQVTLSGVYPVREYLGNSDDLALYLVAPELVESLVAVDGLASLERPLTNIYVHAHGKQGASVGDAFYFEFKFPQGGRSPMRVENRHLHKAHVRAVRSGRSYSGAQLFLNSCFSSGKLGMELLGCSMLLLNAGAHCLIAPREETPAGVARELARAYYNSISLGVNPGQALLAARLQLLGHYRNPIGALYTLLGAVD